MLCGQKMNPTMSSVNQCNHSTVILIIVKPIPILNWWVLGDNKRVGYQINKTSIRYFNLTFLYCIWFFIRWYIIWFNSIPTLTKIIGKSEEKDRQFSQIKNISVFFSWFSHSFCQWMYPQIITASHSLGPAVCFLDNPCLSLDAYCSNSDRILLKCTT